MWAEVPEGDFVRDRQRQLLLLFIDVNLLAPDPEIRNRLLREAGAAPDALGRGIWNGDWTELESKLDIY